MRRFDTSVRSSVSLAGGLQRRILARPCIDSPDDIKKMLDCLSFDEHNDWRRAFGGSALSTKLAVALDDWCLLLTLDYSYNWFLNLLHTTCAPCVIIIIDLCNETPVPHRWCIEPPSSMYKAEKKTPIGFRFQEMLLTQQNVNAVSLIDSV